MEFSAQDWNKIYTIARDLVNVDRNELGKAVSFFRLHQDKAQFLTLLERLSDAPEYIRSQQTRGYFERILRTCRHYLGNVDDKRALYIISWAFRLMSYYQVEQQRDRFQQFGS